MSARQVTPRRVTLEAARRRIAELADLNAFISVSQESGDGPVVAVKDLIDVRGMVTTAGGRQLPESPAAEDAEAVRLLRSHGVVVVGKTNLHEFAYGSTSENAHFGPVRNPHDPSRSAGGSSGGSAVAVAAGMCDWAIGTDTAGSLRIPASACGVVSIKPEPGLIATGGVIPLSRSFDVVGPMAPDVATGASALSMMSGGAFDAAARDLGSLRIAAAPPAWLSFGPVDATTERTWRRVSKHLPAAELPDLAALNQISVTAGMYEATAYHRPWMAVHPERYAPDILERLRLGEGITDEQYGAATALRPHLAGLMEAALDGFDAVLVPATAIVAPPIGGGDVREPMTRFTRPFSVTAHPVVTLPGPSDGLPVGIQVVGHAGGLAALLEVAAALESDWR